MNVSYLQRDGLTLNLGQLMLADKPDEVCLFVIHCKRVCSHPVLSRCEAVGETRQLHHGRKTAWRRSVPAMILSYGNSAENEKQRSKDASLWHATEHTGPDGLVCSEIHNLYNRYCGIRLCLRLYRHKIRIMTTSLTAVTTVAPSMLCCHDNSSNSRFADVSGVEIRSCPQRGSDEQHVYSLHISAAV